MEASKVSWYDGRGNIYTLSEVREIFERRMRSLGQSIIVGSDSHRGRKTHLIECATALCVWNRDNPKGGWYVFHKSSLPQKNFPSLFDRLYYEVQESIDAAVSIRDELGLPVAAVHVNVNPQESEASSKYAAAFRGMVEAYGFKCVLKPNDWAAGSVADKHAR
jgi:predicted RNase H-related nuclease YkuK (DUF458 family)